MSGYQALPSLTSPVGTSTAPPLPEGYAEPGGPSVRERLSSWWKEALRFRAPPSPPPPPSNYLTLIPLSDARLQPRDTRLTVASLLLFGLVIAGMVFITVPRDVSIGEVCVKPDRMSWNTTTSTYQLKLEVLIPIYNPNYLLAHVEGELRVLFYRTEAGKKSIGSVTLPARSAPAVLNVTIDASDVPSDYILAILSQCSTFPEKLVFFLQGSLTAQYLFQRQHLTAIDTYFLIDCRNGDATGVMDPPTVSPTIAPAASVGVAGSNQGVDGSNQGVRVTILDSLEPDWC